MKRYLNVKEQKLVDMLSNQQNGKSCDSRFSQYVTILPPTLGSSQKFHGSCGGKKVTSIADGLLHRKEAELGVCEMSAEVDDNKIRNGGVVEVIAQSSPVRSTSTIVITSPCVMLSHKESFQPSTTIVIKPNQSVLPMCRSDEKQFQSHLIQQFPVSKMQLQHLHSV